MSDQAPPIESTPDLPTTEAAEPAPPPPKPKPKRETVAEKPIYTPKPDPPPPPRRQPPPPTTPTIAEDIDTAVERIRPKVADLADDEIHPEIRLPMLLIRDKLAMVKYAQALGRNKEEAQGRREHLRIPPGIMTLYVKYRTWCENNGKSYWTERGFAAALICYQNGVPIRAAEEEAPQDILDDLNARLGQ